MYSFGGGDDTPHVPKAKLIPEVVLLTYTIGQHFRLSCAI